MCPHFWQGGANGVQTRLAFHKTRTLCQRRTPGQRRMIANYDHWFHAMAREGIGAANRGDFAPENEVDRRFAAMLNSSDSKTVTG